MTQYFGFGTFSLKVISTKFCTGEVGDETEVYSTLVKYTDPSDAKVSSYQCYYKKSLFKVNISSCATHRTLMVVILDCRICGFLPH
jgi:hypothetical protein